MVKWAGGKERRQVSRRFYVSLKWKWVWKFDVANCDIKTWWQKKATYMFSGHGALMLSSILNRKQAIKVNVQVMRIFTRIHQMFVDNTEIRLDIEKIKTSLTIRIKIWRLYFTILMNYLKNRNVLQENRLDINQIFFKLNFQNEWPRSRTSRNSFD